MKTIATLTFAAVALAIAGPSLAASKPSLTSPHAGVLCDKYLCADASGVSRDLTARYIGQAAAEKLFSQGAFDTSQFTLANGVFCDTKAGSCYKDRYFDANGNRSAIEPDASAILFGKLQ